MKRAREREDEREDRKEERKRTGTTKANRTVPVSHVDAAAEKRENEKSNTLSEGSSCMTAWSYSPSRGMRQTDSQSERAVLSHSECSRGGTGKRKSMSRHYLGCDMGRKDAAKGTERLKERDTDRDRNRDRNRGRGTGSVRETGRKEINTTTASDQDNGVNAAGKKEN